jgi:hypothetical protein
MSNQVTTTAPTGNGFALAAVPANPSEAFALCERLAKSELVPKGFQGKPNDIFVAGMMGSRLGLDLFSSLSGIAVVNGRATLWGDSMLAVCQSRSDWGGMTVSFADEDKDPTCIVTVTRNGMPPYSAQFSMSDAKRAGLSGKAGPWTQYPRRMLELRARAFALRGAFADALSGFHAREEMDDVVDVTASATVHTDPKPAKRRTVKPDDSTHSGITSQGTANAHGRETAEDRAEDAAQFSDQNTEAEKTTAEKDVSVERCTADFARLWKLSEAGKAVAKKIQASWRLEKIADLAGSSDDDREAFLMEVGEALAAMEGA